MKLKVEELNSSLDILNSTLVRYAFVDWDDKTTKKHMNETVRNIKEIIEDCNECLNDIKKVREIEK